MITAANLFAVQNPAYRLIRQNLRIVHPGALYQDGLQAHPPVFCVPWFRSTDTPVGALSS
jgi:hypothetical protein